MKRINNYCTLLLLLVLIPGVSIAQSITKTISKHRPITSASEGTATSTESTGQMTVYNEPTAPAANTSDMAGNNAEHAGSGFQIGLNVKKNMLNVKTECSGMIYFITQKGKTKRACLVGEGLSYIFVENMLAPGKYICKFEGINGSIVYNRLTYKPDAGMMLTRMQHKLWPINNEPDNTTRR